jgi:DNA-binding CsgD family transcriptional regulator
MTEECQVQEHHLTDRERELIVSAARGLSNTEIARALGISTPTVKTTLSRAYHKLGAHSRYPAILQALKLGQISLDEIFTEDELAGLLASVGPELMRRIAPETAASSGLSS